MKKNRPLLLPALLLVFFAQIMAPAATQASLVEEETSYGTIAKKHAYEIAHIAIDGARGTKGVSVILDAIALPSGLKVLYDQYQNNDASFLGWAKLALFSIHHGTEWVRFFEDHLYFPIDAIPGGRELIINTEIVSGIGFIVITSCKEYLDLKKLKQN